MANNQTTKFSHVLWTDEFFQLLLKKEEVLSDSLSQNPDDQQLIWRLGEINRKTGRLSEALYYYLRQSSEAEQYRKSNWLSNILEGMELNNSGFGSEPYPSPFLQIKNLLTDPEISELWKLLEQFNDKFMLSTVGHIGQATQMVSELYALLKSR